MGTSTDEVKTGGRVVVEGADVVDGLEVVVGGMVLDGLEVLVGAVAEVRPEQPAASSTPATTR